MVFVRLLNQPPPIPPTGRTFLLELARLLRVPTFGNDDMVDVEKRIAVTLCNHITNGEKPMPTPAPNDEEVATYAYIEEPKAENILDELASWASDQLFTDGREEARPDIEGLIREVKAKARQEGYDAAQSDMAARTRTPNGQSLGGEMVDTERIAHVCHEANRALQVTSPEHNGDVSPHFMEAPEWMVQSAIAGVDEALRGDTPEQLHAAWCDHKTADGWIYGTSKDANKKTHPCLVPYKDLPADQRIKDRVFLAIVHAFKEEA